jgi:hypothetical protein
MRCFRGRRGRAERNEPHSTEDHDRRAARAEPDYSDFLIKSSAARAV